MFSIVMTSLTDKPLLLQLEVWLRPLLGLKGLRAVVINIFAAMCSDKLGTIPFA